MSVLSTDRQYELGLDFTSCKDRKNFVTNEFQLCIFKAACLLAWAVRSTRNKTRLKRWCLTRRYTKPIAILVFPVPVAIVTRISCALARGLSHSFNAPDTGASLNNRGFHRGVFDPLHLRHIIVLLTLPTKLSAAGMIRAALNQMPDASSPSNGRSSVCGK